MANITPRTDKSGNIISYQIRVFRGRDASGKRLKDYMMTWKPTPGMTKRQIFFKVTLLQMIKRIVPPMSNEIITLVKDTSLARIISLQEVIWAGYAFMKGSHGYSGLTWPLFFTGVYYLVFNGGLTLLFGWVEKKLDYFR